MNPWPFWTLGLISQNSVVTNVIILGFVWDIDSPCMIRNLTLRVRGPFSEAPWDDLPGGAVLGLRLRLRRLRRLEPAASKPPGLCGAQGALQPAVPHPGTPRTWLGGTKLRRSSFFSPLRICFPFLWGTKLRSGIIRAEATHGTQSWHSERLLSYSHCQAHAQIFCWTQMSSSRNWQDRHERHHCVPPHPAEPGPGASAY